MSFLLVINCSHPLDKILWVTNYNFRLQTNSVAQKACSEDDLTQKHKNVSDKRKMKKVSTHANCILFDFD